jgi:3-hydroxyethyl bacteriochlorophyllide a dehydrogenase
LVWQSLTLPDPGPQDMVVDIRYSGISTGTEKLFWSGQMPPFPGMGYPLVPGYEAAGEVVQAGRDSGFRPGDMVFVPGASCYGEVKGLFGGATNRLVTAADRAFASTRPWGPRARFWRSPPRRAMRLPGSTRRCPT